MLLVRGTEDVAAPGIQCWSCPPFSASSPSLSMPRRTESPLGHHRGWSLLLGVSGCNAVPHPCVSGCCWQRFLCSSLAPAVSPCIKQSLCCQPVLRYIPKYLCIMFEMPSHRERGERGATLQGLAPLGPSWSPVGAVARLAELWGRAAGQRVAPIAGGSGTGLSPPASKQAENLEGSQWLSWLTRMETAACPEDRLWAGAGNLGRQGPRAGVG